MTLLIFGPRLSQTFFFNDFYFLHYSWFTVFCQFSTIQQSDPVTQTHIHTYIHSFSHSFLHQAPSQVTRYCSQGHRTGSHLLSIPNAIVCIQAFFSFFIKKCLSIKSAISNIILFYIFFGGGLFVFSRAVPTAYRGSQARGANWSCSRAPAYPRDTVTQDPCQICNLHYTTAHGNARSLTH